MKYYVGININGTQKYLHKNSGNYDFCNSAESSLQFNSKEKAQHEILKVFGAYAVFKPFMKVCTDKDIINMRTNATPKNVCPQHKFSNADYHAEQIQAEYDELAKRLKQCDDECMDIAHYMEMRELDVQRGYKAYKMMHDARLRRRKIKDEMLILDNIKKMIASTEEALERREYTPRVRKDIVYKKDEK